MSEELITLTPTALLQEIEIFTQRLNVEPNEKWIQKTPDGKADYIPIGILENELRKDFAGLVQYEIISERRELNEYIVTARIKVFHHVIRQWLSYDGLGCVQIMQDSGASLSSFNETKKKAALQMNAPKAFAEAIKNAAKKIGKKYGADLNRKFEDAYEPDYTIEATLEQVIPMLENCTNVEDLKMLWDQFPELHKSSKFKMAFTNKKLSLDKKI
jgi:hypothetical protein